MAIIKIEYGLIETVDETGERLFNQYGFFKGNVLFRNRVIYDSNAVMQMTDNEITTHAILDASTIIRINGTMYEIISVENDDSIGNIYHCKETKI